MNNYKGAYYGVTILFYMTVSHVSRDSIIL